jgi:hypothetical protein
VVGPDDLSLYLREHFATEREAAKRAVEAHLRAEDRLADDGDEGRTRVVAPPAAVLAATAAGATASSTHRTRRPGWLAALAIAGAVTLVAGLGALVLAGRSGRTPGTVAAADFEGHVLALACASSFKACEGQCVSIDRPDHGCGADACHACNIPNATARCNQQHKCDVAVCYQDYDDCDGDSSNGCETNVRIDPDHCGGCGRKCPALPHAQRGCGDACTIWRCHNGYRDCNGTVEDGCEVGVLTDPANCGECGNACKSGQRCRRGECS